jgi:hypothetical protein
LAAKLPSIFPMVSRLLILISTALVSAAAADAPGLRSERIRLAGGAELGTFFEEFGGSALADGKSAMPLLTVLTLEFQCSRVQSGRESWIFSAHFDAFGAHGRGGGDT